jgi:hypothetical protein
VGCEVTVGADILICHCDVIAARVNFMGSGPRGPNIQVSRAFQRRQASYGRYASLTVAVSGFGGSNRSNTPSRANPPAGERHYSPPAIEPRKLRILCGSN